MQLLVDSLRKDGKVFKNMQKITPKELGFRNKLQIFQATDLQNNFWAIFEINQKSKIFIKDAKKIEEIYEKLKIYQDHNFKFKLLVINAPLCYKANDALKLNNWKIR